MTGRDWAGLVGTARGHYGRLSMFSVSQYHISGTNDVMRTEMKRSKKHDGWTVLMTDRLFMDGWDGVWGTVHYELMSLFALECISVGSFF